MYPLKASGDLDALMKDIGDKHVVMLGEASHGTHEYYTWRTAISKRLILEKGFRFIGVEGDWPDCYRINRFVKGYRDAGDSIADILRSFDRWPTWMWANWEIAALAEWMRSHNAALEPDRKVGFYGLDVYSLWDSMHSIVQYLEHKYPQVAKSAKKAMECFEPFNDNEQLYASQSFSDGNCRDEVLALLQEIRAKSQYTEGDPEAAFNTEQNALIAVNAEKYYRSMTGFNQESWNIRDTHMMETLDRLMSFHGSDAKAIVWEHNTHIGDARATDMARAEMINLGQLARQEYGEDDVYLVGFGSYRGTVIAGDAWGASMKEMELPPAKRGSIEAALHKQGKEDRYILFSEEPGEQYSESIGHRAVGVVYDRTMEGFGNYVPSVLARRYDAFVYLDQTRGLHPLHMQPHHTKMPETYPFGF